MATSLAVEVDKGWSWVVCFGVLVWNIVLSISVQIQGFVFLDLQDLYMQNAITVTWVQFTLGITSTLSSLVGGFLSDTISHTAMRLSLIVLVLVSSLCVAAAGQMPSLDLFVLIYGGIQGVCIGVSDPLVLSLPGRYFDRMRTTAYSISFMGSSIGTLVLPAIYMVCREQYGFRGAMLIFAGIWLQALLTPSVAWPLSEKCTNSARFEYESLMEDNDVIVDDMEYHLQHCNSPEVCNCEQSMKKSSQEDRSVQQQCIPTDETQHIVDKTRQISIGDANTTVYHTAKDNALAANQIHATSGVFCKFIVDKYAVLLTDARLYVVYIIIFSGMLAYYNTYFILPAVAHELGMTNFQTAGLFAILSSVEMCSRVASGHIIDRCNIKKDVFLILTYAAMVIIGLATSTIIGARVLLCFVVLFGILGGHCVSLCIPLMMEVVPETHKGAVSGMFPFLCGISLAIGPVILGAVKESTGSYINSFRVSISFYALAFPAYVLQLYLSQTY